jgi:AcrR family transcriptional regulator
MSARPQNQYTSVLTLPMYHVDAPAHVMVFARYGETSTEPSSAKMQDCSQHKAVMTPIPKSSKRKETSSLSRDDWLDAAFAAVTQGGFDNVRVLTIADSLGVTRGSFYWHFADHAELVAALLSRWLAREIELDLTFQADATDDAQADLERLLEAALSHVGVGLKNMLFELSVRSLARRDPAVAVMLVHLDQRRLGLFESKFVRLTGDPKTASELANLFYLSIAGSHSALARPGSPPQAKEYFRNIIARYLIQSKPGAGGAP